LLISILQPSAKESEGRAENGPDLSGLPDDFAERIRRHHRRRLSIHEELEELAEMAVVAKRQQQVGDIFLYYATLDEPFNQSTAIQGLARWATKQHAPAMAKLLTTKIPGIDWPERQDIIQALGRFKSPQVYRAIASRLVEFTERDEATEALIGFGSDAEKEVCKVLDHKSHDAREAAAEILEKIGTRKSLAPLKKALKEEPNTFARKRIRDAIEAIRKR